MHKSSITNVTEKSKLVNDCVCHSNAHLNV